MTKHKCRKRSYRTELDAKIALASANRVGRGPERPKYEKRAYKCPGRSHWHLTSRA